LPTMPAPMMTALARMGVSFMEMIFRRSLEWEQAGPAARFGWAAGPAEPCR
jgi:hypothetical protein